MKKGHFSKLLAALLSLTMLLSLLPAGAMAAGTDKIDVWDFGAEQLDESVYNNRLTVDEINSWYPDDVTAGTEGNTIPSFTSSDGSLSFSDGGKPNTHRIRTMNEAVTRRDAKSLEGEDGTIYNGYIYSNSGKNPDVYVALQLNSGDKVTVIVGSNGGESMITLTDPNGEVEAEQNFDRGAGKAQTMVFYPKQDGLYKFWSSTEKLVIARIYREKAADVAVSGSVNTLEGLSGHSVAFTNTTNGAVTAAKVENGSYTATLKAPFDYELSLLDANGYVIDSETKLSLNAESAAVTCDVTVREVERVTLSGKIVGLDEASLGKLKLTLSAEAIYTPEVTIEGDSYTARVEKGMETAVSVADVNDYDLASAASVTCDEDTTADIVFTPKPTHKVTIAPEGAKRADLKKAVFTFTNLKEEGYTYAFTGTDDIALRDGVYTVAVTELDGYTQKLTSNVVVDGKDMTKTIGFEKITKPVTLPYKATVTVGAKGCDYKTLGEAMDAVRAMKRGEDQRVTISVQPGNYEEMLVVDVPNVTLKNASETPSLSVIDKGVNIDENAVRITWYYGCGYNYYSMNENCKYDAELLAVNKENGYESFVNPGDGTDNDSYWNSTVIIKASGFRAEGIIFENSFNQYVSAKSVEDVIVPNAECKEDKNAPRSEMKTVGDTTVQGYVYKERAGALSIADNCTQVYFENCKFIGRQDTLYGGVGTVAAFYDCDILGSTDYIYGPMTAVFAKCDLKFNTSEHEFDLGYVTAPRHTEGRGFLMYNCTIGSTTPGVDTASELVSKPGYFGRPWQANTGETVFYKTVIEPSYDNVSMILPEGWFDSLSGKSPLCGEYDSYEQLGTVDNTDKRVSWAASFTEPKLADGSDISVETYLGGWDAFAGKDMTVVTRSMADAKADVKTVQVKDKSVELKTLTIGGEDYVWIRDAAVALADTDARFNVTWKDGVDLVKGEKYVPAGAEDTSALTAKAPYAEPAFSTSVDGKAGELKAVVFTDAQGGGYTCYSLTDLAQALGVTVK